jgi:hypothetical protein
MSRGTILAGGSGPRLGPTTIVVSKQLPSNVQLIVHHVQLTVCHTSTPLSWRVPSRSRHRVSPGLHHQLPSPQDKLVRVVRDLVHDVAADRADSATSVPLSTSAAKK